VPGPDGAFTQKRHRNAHAGTERPAEPLTPAEVAGLLAACSRASWSGTRDRAMITVLYRSGLRVSELLGLRLSDLDAGARTLRLRHTKAGRPQTRGYHPAADDALALWLQLRRPMGPGPLFCTRAGGPIWPQQVRATLARLAARAQIDKAVRPHGLRHTLAVELLHAGEDMAMISKVLGHSSIATTARYLDHLTNSAALARLAAASLPALGP
jgi:site-specific recombinase XerD